ncbi:LysR family transcriptional regulator [Lacticaseibacillus zhaodongensis]|uniref:LysR family transcriptional regulator n=1 Tax=Lacticaseibacillus zhaodongensis TaxID=2668065 RepID=UPI0012D34722|nr:LysR family transcriptional regulator [Lacticaseibacillus zhaodongensis]
MNIRDLEYFNELVHLKNFSQVAAAFQVSQPTISMALKRLETDLGIELIERDHSHGTLKVTAAGQQLYRHTQIMLSELSTARSELTALQTQTITLGLPPIIANYYFPQLVPRLMAGHVMEHLQTVEAGSGELLKRLRAGELDMALLGSIGPLESSDLETIEISNSRFAIIASPERKLGTAGQIAFAELSTTPFVSLTTGFVHTQAIAQLQASSNAQLRTVFRTSDVGLLKKMVRQNVGVALLTTMAISPDDHLQVLQLSDADQPHFAIAVARRKQQLLSAPLRKLQHILITQN